MKLQVLRNNQQSKHSTLGKLFIEDAFECFTLEPPKDPDPQGNGCVCISEGAFDLNIYWSNRWGRHVPHVDHVPSRSAIEIHPGNYPSNTDGCTIVGTSVVADVVEHSQIAFTNLMTKLFALATLTNPEAPERDHFWKVGIITYKTEDLP